MPQKKYKTERGIGGAESNRHRSSKKGNNTNATSRRQYNLGDSTFVYKGGRKVGKHDFFVLGGEKCLCAISLSRLRNNR